MAQVSSQPAGSPATAQEPAPRIVITGAGVVSPLGVGMDEFAAALYSTAHARSADGHDEPCGIPDFDPQRWLGPKGIRVLDRGARLLCVAAHLALRGIAPEPRPDAAPAQAALGLVYGTMLGSLHSIVSFDWSGLTDGPTYVNPSEFPNTVINSAAGQTAIRHGLQGVNATISAGLASALYAVAYAELCLKVGRAPMLLAGGVEELGEELLTGFARSGYLSENGHSQPFASDRSGVRLGEGCALLVLESAASARARKAEAWAELAGVGFAHDRCPGYGGDGRAATRAIEQAVAVADIAPAEIGCIVSSANGSPRGDAMEARALSAVFQSQLGCIPVCAPKAALGETAGASGAFALLAGVIALQRRQIPPTFGFTGSDSGLRLSPNAQPFDGDHVLVNAFSCDGSNAAMVLRRSSGGDN